MNKCNECLNQKHDKDGVEYCQLTGKDCEFYKDDGSGCVNFIEKQERKK